MKKQSLALCRTCRFPIPSSNFRRYSDGMRHDSCITCEDAKTAAAKKRKQEWSREYYLKKKQSMANKPILSTCVICNESLPGNRFRRDSHKLRHETCISCEDAKKLLKKLRLSDEKRKRADRARRYYISKTGKIPEPISAPKTSWIGGGYPG